jgi:hypothetical protein
MTEACIRTQSSGFAFGTAFCGLVNLVAESPRRKVLAGIFIGEAMLSVWNVAPQDNGHVFLVLRVVPDFFDLNVRISISRVQRLKPR